MGFKLEKKISKILEMDFVTYSKYLKKEIKKAAKFGVIDAVICEKHTFADGKVSSLVLLGVYTGELALYFKANKTAEGFAKGTCFFETTKEGTTMHIVINAGKGKPDKIKKTGKKLWEKAGITTTFHKKELPILSKKLDDVNLGEEQLKKEVDKANDTQLLETLWEDFVRTSNALSKKVIPLIVNKETKDSAYDSRHFEMAKENLKAALSLLDKLKEVPPKVQEKWKSRGQKAQDDYPKIKRIAAKIKEALMATNAVDINLNNKASNKAQTAAVTMSLDALNKEFEQLAVLEKQAQKAIKYLENLPK